MPEKFDRDRVIECMFDPVTSSMIAELEGGSRTLSYLAESASVPESEVAERLSYMIECGFIRRVQDGQDDLLSADTDRLTGMMEEISNFDSAIEGLEKMDSYLN